ncbi:unnamed protein product [Adineta steineri]|uniref:F-box domain-containing protein n=2 Tax=Adineta steineri TaxID=433720 RepID=A0A815HIM8_9BILA|nr:unnamed protein product [Adineta steineri]
MSMYLELLPNELLFNIFQYLSTPDVLRIFCQLNRRFDKLVDKHLYTCKYIDLQTTSKFNFDLIWEQYLSPLAGKITSLSLSNDVNTPDQVDQFYAHGFTLRHFPQLQSLALFHIHSKEIIDKIANDLPHLTTLTHLTFEKSIFNYQYMINIIWSLSNLVYFRFNTYSGSEQQAFHTPRVTSSTIKSIHGFFDERDTNIIALLRHTPQIRSLSLTIHACSFLTDLSTNITSITKLDLLFTKPAFSPLVDFLRRTPNLIYLKLDMVYNGIHAQVWERLIQKYLPNLKTLHFKMNFTIVKAGSTGERQVEQILNTFRNSFWLDEHRWFVQCDWSPITEKCYVYTLPYAFENFNIDFPICSKFTCAIDNTACFYDCVRRLTFNATPDHLYDSLTLSHIQFSNIQHITIDLIGDKRFRCKTGQHDSSAYNCEVNCLNQLQHILEQYRRVTSLRLCGWPSAILKMPHCSIKDVSVFELDLQCRTGREYYYTQEECDQFSRSILGIQCKILTIDVIDWTCVYNLITKMNNLQMLNVRCRYHQPNSSQVSNERDLMEWLHKNIQDVFSDIKRITWKRKSIFIER